MDFITVLPKNEKKKKLQTNSIKMSHFVKH